MGRITLIIVGLAVAASVVVTTGIERHSADRQTAQTDALKELTAQIAQATKENARLTSLAARGPTAPPLSQEQFKDLIRLRNEVGQLHKLTNETAQLEATNARLREMEMKSRQTLDAARALPNYWPKDRLAFAGFGDPASAVKSMLAAMKDGDWRALTNCFDPASTAALDAEMKRDGGDPAAKEAEIKRDLSDFMSLSDGFHIVDQTMTGPDETTINLSMDGEGRVQKFVLRKFGGEWKIANGN